MKKKIFLTIDLSEEIKGAFRDQEKRWKNLNVFWIGFSSLFLTMEYFGVVDKPELNKIKEALEKTAQETKPFNIKLSKIVLGPNEQDPKMFWATIMEDQEVKAFRENLYKNLREADFEMKEREFIPHVVLAFAKGNQLKGRKTSVPLKGKIEAKEINLMFSQTYTKNSIKHKLLETFVLGE